MPRFKVGVGFGSFDRTFPEALGNVTDFSVYAVGDSAVSVNWTRADNAVNQKVQYSEDFGRTWTTFVTLDKFASSATITGLENDLFYMFRVQSVAASGYFKNSNTDEAVPETSPLGTIEDFAVVSVGDGIMNVQWTPAENTLSQELQYRAVGATDWNIDDDSQLSSTSTSHQFTGLTNTTEYEARVVAYGESASQIESNTASGTPTGTPVLGTISDLAGTAGDTRIDLAWTPAANATSQQPQYKESSSGTWLNFGSALSGSASSASITGLTNSTSYDTRIRASDGSTTTDSNIVTKTPAAPGVLGTALLVTRNATMEAGDQAVYDKLVEWGWTVTNLPYTNISEGSSEDVVVISPDAPGGWNGWTPWRNSTRPICVLNRAAGDIATNVITVCISTESGFSGITTMDRSSFQHPDFTFPAPGTEGFQLNEDGTIWDVVQFEVGPEASILGHALGDRFAPYAVFYERGANITGSFDAPGRRAAMVDLKERPARWTASVWGMARDLVAWCAAQPAAGSPIARFSAALTFATGNSTIVCTDDSTPGTGETLTNWAWSLRDADDVEVDTSTSQSPTFTGVANGPHTIRLTVTDSAAATHTWYYYLVSEQVDPATAFTYTQTDSSPASNQIHAVDDSQDRGVAITQYDWVLYESDGTTVVDSAPNSGSTYDSPLLANDTYVLALTATNADGGSAEARQTIEVPTPLASEEIIVDGVGQYPYAYLTGSPAAGESFTSVEWDFDTDNPGTVIGSGVHPGNGDRDAKPMVASASVAGTEYNYSCTVTQSNGYQKTFTGTWLAWQNPDWGARGEEDYTTPTIVAGSANGFRDLWVDADAASDGDGLTQGNPIKLLSTLTSAIQAGDKVHLKGDFRSQNESIRITNFNGSTSAVKWIMITKWPGEANPMLGGASPVANVYVSSSPFVALVDLDSSAQGVEPATARQELSRVISSDNFLMLRCTHDGGQDDVTGRGAFNSLFMDNSKNWWVEGNSFDLVGGNPTVGQGNGGNAFLIYRDCHSGTFYNNYVGRSGHVAIQWLISSDRRSRHCRFAHNRVENIWAGTIGPAGGMGMLVEENYFWDTGLTEQINSVGSEVGLGIRGDFSTWRYNKIWNPARSAIQMQSHSASGRQLTRRNHVYHNTFIGGRFGYNMFHTDIPQLNNLCPFQDNIVENCIMHDNEGMEWPKGSGRFWQFRIQMASATNWSIDNLWKMLGTANIQADLSGNISRHNNLSTSVSPFGFMIVVRQAPEGGNITYETIAEAEQHAPTRLHNHTNLTPSFISTDDSDPVADELYQLSPGSPLLGAGIAVPGETYSGGQVPVGWYPPSAGGGTDVIIPNAADFTDHGLILNPGSVGQWDARVHGMITPCSIVRVGTDLILYYLGADGNRSDGGPAHRKLGAATLADGANVASGWNKVAGNPLVAHNPNPGVGNENEEGVFSAGAYWDGSAIQIIFGGMEAISANSVDGDGMHVGMGADGLTPGSQTLVLNASLGSTFGAGDEIFPFGLYRTPAGVWWCIYTYKGSPDGVSWEVAWANGNSVTSLPTTQAVPETVTNRYTGSDPLSLGGGRVIVPLFSWATERVEIWETTDDALPSIGTKIKDWDFGDLGSVVGQNMSGIALWLDEDRELWFFAYMTSAWDGIRLKTAPLVRG